MEWIEHEKIYCEEVFSLDGEDIYNIANSWADACKYLDYFEMGYEEGNTAPLKNVKYKGKYYTIFDETK